MTANLPEFAVLSFERIKRNESEDVKGFLKHLLKFLSRESENLSLRQSSSDIPLPCKNGSLLLRIVGALERFFRL
jgi:hypothetical protein